jgi:hypothetical protein
MNYLEFEIGGKLRSFKFNQLAIEKLAEKNQSGTNIGFIYSMVYAGLYAATYAKSEAEDYTFNDVSDWVDNLEDDTIINKLTIALTESQLWKKLVKKGQEIEDEKKKVTQKLPTKI